MENCYSELVLLHIPWLSPILLHCYLFLRPVMLALVAAWMGGTLETRHMVVWLVVT